MFWTGYASPQEPVHIPLAIVRIAFKTTVPPPPNFRPLSLLHGDPSKITFPFCRYLFERFELFTVCDKVLLLRKGPCNSLDLTV